MAKNLCHLQQRLRPSADPIPICHVDQVSLCLCNIPRMPTYSKNVFSIIAVLYGEECLPSLLLETEPLEGEETKWAQERC
jgi:hypothetical protein